MPVRYVAFSLPEGYSLATHGRGYVFTHGGATYFLEADTRSPFPTPGAAVRALIKHAAPGLHKQNGEAAAIEWIARLRDQIAALPEAYR